jgi:hypothetical protein
LTVKEKMPAGCVNDVACSGAEADDTAKNAARINATRIAKVTIHTCRIPNLILVAPRHGL